VYYIKIKKTLCWKRRKKLLVETSVVGAVFDSGSCYEIVLTFYLLLYVKLIATNTSSNKRSRKTTIVRHQQSNVQLCY